MFTTNKSQIQLWNFSYKLQTCAKIFTSRELCEGRICKYSLHHCLAYTRNNRSFSAVFWRSKASLKFKNIFINLYSFSSIMITKYGTSLHTSSIFSTTQSGHHHLSSIRAPNWPPCSHTSQDNPVSMPIMSDSLWPHGFWPARLLCPWDSPGKNTRVGCHCLLQGIFPTQGFNPSPLCILHYRQVLYQWDTWENPIPVRVTFFDPDKNF